MVKNRGRSVVKVSIPCDSKNGECTPPEPKASGSNPLGRIPENKRLSFSSALIILSVGSLRHFLANLDLQSLVFHLGVSPFFTTASRRLAKIRPICRGR